MTEKPANNTAIVDLDTPLVRGETTIDKVTLRKPNGGSMRGVKMVDLWNMDTVAVSKVVPRISSPVITEAEFMTMEASDCAAIAGEISNFLLSNKQKAEAGLT